MRTDDIKNLKYLNGRSKPGTYILRMKYEIYSLDDDAQEILHSEGVILERYAFQQLFDDIVFIDISEKLLDQKLLEFSKYPEFMGLEIRHVDIRFGHISDDTSKGLLLEAGYHAVSSQASLNMPNLGNVSTFVSDNSSVQGSIQINPNAEVVCLKTFREKQKSNP